MTTTYPNKLMRTAELQLGDEIQLFNGPFGHAIVTKIDGGAVHYFRPYATTADFSYTGGVIPYIGVEQNTLCRESAQQYYVTMRKELR